MTSQKTAAEGDYTITVLSSTDGLNPVQRIIYFYSIIILYNFYFLLLTLLLN